ncbi:MAG TPA: protein kinase [Pyrinomonadaceae bacterium]
MMKGLEKYVGEVLDDKYRLEHLLGSGGMGAVYLATHLGTARYVALKLIAPQFMRNEEFVERFKREARAAGRLRHPNVVDVTDFGFARVANGQVAYLVMEYLDGCTLGDVLAEEERLPLEWVVDILEQVCSAVHEAHQQGIVHRDLKPDNIWLEPNRLGSYRVKVLDFGIAKLGEAAAPAINEDPTSTIVDDLSAHMSSTPTAVFDFPPDPPRGDSETPTLLQDLDEVPQYEVAGEGDEAGTQIFAAKTALHESSNLTAKFASERENQDDNDGTLLFSEGTHHAGTRSVLMTTMDQSAALTRVGAIMGTPLYMSPEQCSGGQIDTRSDIYSLGVIAYQMLAGEPPFSGNTSTVMKSHREENPKHLRERATKVPKRVARVVMSALSKVPSERPQTAFAFASSLRGNAEGVGALYRRAFSLYSEYFPKFLKLSFLAHIPVIVTSLLMTGMFVLERYIGKGSGWQKVAFICGIIIVGLLQILAYFVSSAIISGVTAIIVVQLSVAPLRPVRLREAIAVGRKRLRPFISTMVRLLIRLLIGYMLFIIPGIVMSIRYALYAPVVLIEGLEKKAALKRARQLASRSWRTVIIVSVLQLLIPMTVSTLVGRIKLGNGRRGAVTISQTQKEQPQPQNNSNTAVSAPTPGGPTPTKRENPDRENEDGNLSQQIWQQVLGLVNILIVPLISIVPALLYLKMRQLGGETLSDAVQQMEDVNTSRSQWQQRMRTRLSLHTPLSGKTTNSRPDTPRPTRSVP